MNKQEFLYADFDRNREVIYEGKIKFNHSEFTTFIYYFPNIRKIDFGQSVYIGSYMDYVKQLDSFESKHLDYITADKRDFSLTDEEDVKTSHFFVIYNFCRTLAKLKVFEHNNMLPDMDDNCLVYLCDFSNMARLEFYADKSATQLTSIDVCKDCPNLTKIKFYNPHLIAVDSDSTIMNELQSIQCQIITIVAVNPAFYLQYLRQLELTLSIFTPEYIKHLVQFLQNLSITLQGIDFYGWINEIEFKNVLQFAHYQRLHFLFVLQSHDWNNHFSQQQGFSADCSTLTREFDIPTPDILQSFVGFKIIHQISFRFHSVNMQHPLKVIEFILNSCRYL